MSAGLWVWIEHDGRRPRKASLEALGKARELGGPAVALLLGHRVGAMAEGLAPLADRVVVVDAEPLARFASDAYAGVLSTLAAEGRGVALLAGATFNGRELLPRVAARLGAPFWADCVDLRLDDGALLGRRALYGGKAYVWLRGRGGGTVVATTRPNAFALPAASAPGAVETASVEARPTVAQVLEVKLGAVERPELTEAEVVVAGGRGLASPEGFQAVERLADALGGAVGASRAVVDAGWREHGEQVGKSGKTVSPKLYVALGISGAIHHVMGMDTATVVVAVNRDPAAPIFKQADYGLVGDAAQIATALAERLGSLSS